MKIYKEKDNEKRTFQCSYCYNTGHNKRQCPHLKAHYLANKNWLWGAPMRGIGKSMFPTHYQLFFGQAKAAQLFQRHFRYAEGIYGEQEKKVQKKRRKPKCGFCGSEEHNRRSCETMKSFAKVLCETEQEYRAKFYDQIISGMGVGVGAYVEFGRQGWSPESPYEEVRQGLITDFDLSSISIGNKQAWGDYHTPMVWKFNGEAPIGSRWSYGLIAKRYAMEMGYTRPISSPNGGSWVITNVIAPSPTTPDKDWFLGQSPEFNWVVRKRNLVSLQDNYELTIKNHHPDGASVLNGFQKLYKGFRK